MLVKVMAACLLLAGTASSAAASPITRAPRSNDEPATRKEHVTIRAECHPAYDDPTIFRPGFTLMRRHLQHNIQVNAAFRTRPRWRVRMWHNGERITGWVETNGGSPGYVAFALVQDRPGSGHFRYRASGAYAGVHHRCVGEASF